MKPRIASRRPEPNEVEADYHWKLIDGINGDCILKILDDQLFWLCELASNISVEQIDKVHVPYGWTIRQVFDHCACAERVFGYRMMRFAAGDSTELPGWDENSYADARFGLGNFTHIVSELDDLRKSNLMLLRRIRPASWDNGGVADGVKINTRGLAWVAAGHLHHHLAIVEKRCGVTVNRYR